MEFYHGFLRMCLFFPLTFKSLEFWDKVLFIFAFAILSTMSQSLKQYDRDLIVFMVYVHNICKNGYCISLL